MSLYCYYKVSILQVSDLERPTSLARTDRVRWFSHCRMAQHLAKKVKTGKEGCQLNRGHQTI